MREKGECEITLSRQARALFTASPGDVLFWRSQDGTERIVVRGEHFLKHFDSSSAMAQEMGFRIAQIPDFSYHIDIISYFPVVDPRQAMIAPPPPGDLLQESGRNSGNRAGLLDAIAREVEDRFGKETVADILVQKTDPPTLFFLSTKNLSRHVSQKK